MSKQAFILRMAPSGVDRVPECLAGNYVCIGWSFADGLIEAKGWEEFRRIIQTVYHATDTNLRAAGKSAGHMWRFLKEMNIDDLVVVPYGPDFYVAKVTGAATYSPEHASDDTAYRRPVQWLNGGDPIPRKHARAALISRMKVYGTSAGATDLVEEVEECLELAASGRVPSFEEDLRTSLVAAVLKQMRDGRIDDRGFERLVKSVLLDQGATKCSIVPRPDDKGADLIATYLVAGTFPLNVAVQVKHWRPYPPVGPEVVEQLIRGVEVEGANLGMVVTCGAISEEANKIAQRYFDEKGIRIEMVDGEQLAKMIVERGLSTPALVDPYVAK